MTQRACALILGYSQNFKGVYSKVGKSTYCANVNIGLVCLLLLNNRTNRISEGVILELECQQDDIHVGKNVWHPNPRCIKTYLQPLPHATDLGDNFEILDLSGRVLWVFWASTYLAQHDFAWVCPQTYPWVWSEYHFTYSLMYPSFPYILDQY